MAIPEDERWAVEKLIDGKWYRRGTGETKELAEMAKEILEQMPQRRNDIYRVVERTE